MPDRRRRLLRRHGRGGPAGAAGAGGRAPDAKTGGAAGVLVFPPTPFMWGAQHRPDMVLRHFGEIASRADLPIVVFEYPPASGIGSSPETLPEGCALPHAAAREGRAHAH